MPYWRLKTLSFLALLLAVPGYSKLTPAKKPSAVSKIKKLCEGVKNAQDSDIPEIEDLSFNCSGFIFSIEDGKKALREYRRGRITEQEFVNRHLNKEEEELFVIGIEILEDIIEVGKSKTVTKNFCKKTLDKVIEQNQVLRKDLQIYISDNKLTLSLPTMELIHVQNVESSALKHKHHLLLNLHADIIEHLQQKCETYIK